MAEQIYSESNYRFTDPIRFFKANDPYYFEVDNIPLKQLQENCLWLKDQVRKGASSLTRVTRADIEELRPFATGADRVVRVNPGRYTARINDASLRTPLAYLRKVAGDYITQVDQWGAATPNPGSLPGNALLEAALDRFKTAVAEDALGMNGLVERAFTWPIYDTEYPVSLTGALVDDSNSWLSYANELFNSPGGGANRSPFLITEAILWAKSEGASIEEFLLGSYSNTNSTYGWSTFPLTESYFIKAWRGISRTAIVDVPEEISVEIPPFDSTDFSYTDGGGNSVAVDNVQQRIDLVFIYSKPVDASASQIIRDGSVEQITRPVLGVVKGAGIRANFQEKISDLAAGYKDPTRDSILAAPGDQYNSDMGFTAASANDIPADVRGSFPAPDDLLNIAPLISQKLEDNAYELIGQSILPVAYVFVQGGSQLVLSTDVIDIRPLFRTAELTYNERAGIAAAFPQLSLANPAVGKSHLDYVVKTLSDDVNSRLTDLEMGASNPAVQMTTLAMGYVFGGYNFGPEGALFDFYQTAFSTDNDPDNDTVTFIKNHISSKYGMGGLGVLIDIPTKPDWDPAAWAITLNSQKEFPNDCINTFISTGEDDPNSFFNERAIVAGSNRGEVFPPDTESAEGRCRMFNNADVRASGPNVYFHYVSKKIQFIRPDWLLDYDVDVKLLNCLAQNSTGSRNNKPGDYQGMWVEKGPDYFTIYVAYMASSPNTSTQESVPKFPAPRTVTTAGGNVISVSERGGERFSGWIVPVEDILYSDPTPIDLQLGFPGLFAGYEGNPRVGKCTLPTVQWKITGVPLPDAQYLYGNLSDPSTRITLKGG